MKFLAVFLLSLLVLTGCNKTVIKSSMEEIPISVSDIEQPDFNSVKAKVLASSCIECHSATQKRGGVRLDNYASTFQAISQVQASIEDGSMPKGKKLSDVKKKLILSWIAAGAPLSKGQTSATMIKPEQADLPQNYASVKKHVIDRACVTCHNSDRADGKVMLETYAQVFRNAKLISETVFDGSMPKKGKLSAMQKTLILNWIDDGAPEQSDKVLKASAVAETSTVAKIKDSAVIKKEFEQQILARGKYLYELSSCNSCHTSEIAQPLAGGEEMKTPFGSFFPPNISADVKTGIGGWSAKDFVRALRDGIGPKGQRYFPSFPFTNYSKMTNEDMLSIRAYILSLPGVEKENKQHQLSFPYSQRWLLKAWQLINFPDTKKDQDDKNFLLARGPFVQVPEKSMAWNRGAYLVEGPLHCTQCHTPRGELGGLLIDQWMAGSDVSGGETPAPNITPDLETGLGYWTQNTWATFLTEGLMPNGEKVSGKMWKVVSDGTSRLTDSDRSAVIEYLLSMPRIKNKQLADKIGAKGSRASN